MSEQSEHAQNNLEPVHLTTHWMIKLSVWGLLLFFLYRTATSWIDGSFTAGALFLIGAGLCGVFLLFAQSRVILHAEGFVATLRFGRYEMRWDEVQKIEALQNYRLVMFYGNNKRYGVSTSFAGNRKRVQLQAFLETLIGQKNLEVQYVKSASTMKLVRLNFLTLLCLGLLGPVLVPSLYSLEIVAERWYVRSQLAQNVQTTWGIVTDYRFVPSADDPNTAYVTYQFDAIGPDGVAQRTTNEQLVDPAFIDDFAIGTQVPVVYAASNIAISRIDGASDALTGALILAALSNGILLLILAGLIAGLRRTWKQANAALNNEDIA